MKSLIPITALAAALAVGAPAAAQLAQNSKAPVDITADELETANAECTSTWRGSAEALQDTARLRADVLTAHMQTKSAKPAKAGSTSGGCGDLVSLEAKGSVYYVTADQKVRGDAALYDAASNTITVTGDVVAVQGQNVLRGSKMVFNTETGQGQMQGAAKGRNAKDRPRGVFYPNQTKSGAPAAKPPRAAGA